MQKETNSPDMQYLTTEIAELTTQLNRMQATAQQTMLKMTKNLRTTATQTMGNDESKKQPFKATQSETKEVKADPQSTQHKEKKKTRRAKKTGKRSTNTSPQPINAFATSMNRWTSTIFASMLSPHFLLFILFALTLTPTQAIRAYDCSRPAISEQISLVDIESCPEANPTMIQQQSRVYHIYQESMTKATFVTECRLQVAELVIHCGMHHHTSLTSARLTPKIIPLTAVQCQEARKFGNLVISQQIKIEAKMNKTTVTKLFAAGRIYSNGKCSGESYTVNGETFGGMVAYREYSFTMTTYSALFDFTTGFMLTNGYSFCKISEGICDTGDSLLLYEEPAETCQLTFLKSVEFSEIKGRSWNHEQPAYEVKRTGWANISTTWTNMNYKETPTVLMSKNNKDLIRFVLKNHHVPSESANNKLRQPDTNHRAGVNSQESSCNHRHPNFLVHEQQNRLLVPQQPCINRRCIQRSH
jgi:hypothetical protein